jgi:hypothetical protein
MLRVEEARNVILRHAPRRCRLSRARAWTAMPFAPPTPRRPTGKTRHSLYVKFSPPACRSHTLLSSTGLMLRRPLQESFGTLRLPLEPFGVVRHDPSLGFGAQPRFVLNRYP